MGGVVGIVFPLIFGVGVPRGLFCGFVIRSVWIPPFAPGIPFVILFPLLGIMAWCRVPVR